jgi:hypothetical protein
MGGADRQRSLLAQYEQLRCDALSQGGLAPHGLGLALLLRQGMTAWIRAWSKCANDDHTSSSCTVRLAAPLSSEVRSQLTHILANLLTRPLHETRS